MVWMQSWIQPQAFFAIKAKDHIAVMDTNGDGGVDWTEFAEFMKPHIVEALKEGRLSPEIGGMLEEAKSDEEIAAQDKLAMDGHLKRFKELFNEADLNKDGKLTETEMEANLKDRESWMALAAANGVIDMADDSKDGKLSLNEVIKNADKFGAKTEDFFEDQDLLSVDEADSADTGDADAEKPGTFVQKSLRGAD
jgi:hypothetical protein